MSLAFLADDGRNTTLPLFDSSSQIQTVTFMLGSTAVELRNRRHADSSTSLEVFLRQIHDPPASTASPAIPTQDQQGASDSRQAHKLIPPGAVAPAIKRPDEEATTDAAQRSSDAGTSPKTKKDTDYVKEMRGCIMVLATLFASMTYQAGLNPPGGFWQDDSSQFLAPISVDGSDSTSNSIAAPAYNTGNPTTVNYNVTTGHRAGDPVLRDKLLGRYRLFFNANTIAFSHSLGIMLYLLVDVNLQKKKRVVILQTIVIIDVFLIMLAYFAGSWCTRSAHYLTLLHAVSLFLAYGWYGWRIPKARRGCSSGQAEGDVESRTATKMQLTGLYIVGD